MPGLAGLLVAEDDGEDGIDLPREPYDFPLVLQDRLFNPDNQLVYLTHHMNHMRSTINNRIFEMQGVAEEETVSLDTTEVWEFVNRGGMPPLPHPIHIYGLQFKVLGRLGAPFGDVLDKGWIDTSYLLSLSFLSVRERADVFGLNFILTFAEAFATHSIQGAVRLKRESRVIRERSRRCDR